MIKWGLITFGIGMALIVIEIVMAGRKKEGVTATDKKNMLGLFWITLCASGLVMGLIAMNG